MASAAEDTVSEQRRMVEALEEEKKRLQDELAEMRAKVAADSSRSVGEQGDAPSAGQPAVDGGRAVGGDSGETDRRRGFGVANPSSFTPT